MNDPKQPRRERVEQAPGGDIRHSVRVTETDLRVAIGRIGDAYGKVPAGQPTREQVDVALPGLYEAIGDALILVGHPAAPARGAHEAPE